ncbi:hypothetical protein D9M69_652520 [compost metagenome]
MNILTPEIVVRLVLSYCVVEIFKRPYVHPIETCRYHGQALRFLNKGDVNHLIIKCQVSGVVIFRLRSFDGCKLFKTRFKFGRTTPHFVQEGID